MPAGCHLPARLVSGGSGRRSGQAQPRGELALRGVRAAAGQAAAPRRAWRPRGVPLAAGASPAGLEGGDHPGSARDFVSVVHAQRSVGQGAGARWQGALAPGRRGAGGAQAASEAPSHSSGVSVGERPGSPSGGPPAWDGSPPHARAESGALRRRSGLPDGAPAVPARVLLACTTRLLAVPLQRRDGTPPYRHRCAWQSYVPRGLGDCASYVAWLYMSMGCSNHGSMQCQADYCYSAASAT